MDRMATVMTALLILTGLTACDSRSSAEFGEERSNRLYQAAMSDFSAGRIDAAVKGFEKVLRDVPGHASARFQLACLLQDNVKDYLGALANYRVYLQVAPDSDKVRLAKDRMAICERHLSEAYAKKAGGTDSAAALEEIERLKAELAAQTEACAKRTKELESSRASAKAAERENERLRKLLASMDGSADDPVEKTDVASFRDLLDADDEPEEKTSAIADAKRLNALAESEDAEAASSSLLPQQAADAKERKKAAEDAKRKAQAEKMAAAAAIPETYVVADGDTLYKIAVRFYGKTSAWKRIREANRETISTDGRVRKGQVIRLPR